MAHKDPKHTIVVHSIGYTKADLDAAPPEEKTFYLMAGSVANDLAMLNKALLATVATPDHGHRISSQGISTGLFLILRMLSGRLVEAHKLTSSFSQMIKKRYLDELSAEARDSFYDIHKYFSGKRSLLLEVRDSLAAHHLRENVEQSYASLDDGHDLGDYLSEHVGNTLYYTAELLHYETLTNLSSLPHSVAIEKWIDDATKQSANFGTFLHGFAYVFAQRFLSHKFESILNEREVIPVADFRNSSMPFFTTVPEPK